MTNIFINHHTGEILEKKQWLETYNKKELKKIGITPEKAFDQDLYLRFFPQ